jgi:hypothetical protein
MEEAAEKGKELSHSGHPTGVGIDHYTEWLDRVLLPQMHIICTGGALVLSSAWCSNHSLLS